MLLAKPVVLTFFSHSLHIEHWRNHWHHLSMNVTLGPQGGSQGIQISPFWDGCLRHTMLYVYTEWWVDLYTEKGSSLCVRTWDVKCQRPASTSSWLVMHQGNWIVHLISIVTLLRWLLLLISCCWPNFSGGEKGSERLIWNQMPCYRCLQIQLMSLLLSISGHPDQGGCGSVCLTQWLTAPTGVGDWRQLVWGLALLIISSVPWEN